MFMRSTAVHYERSSDNDSKEYKQLNGIKCVISSAVFQSQIFVHYSSYNAINYFLFPFVHVIANGRKAKRHSSELRRWLPFCK